jgi:alkanesulfonate monooxygenase SsuD/methylene tetrahydromethanopterin reductase-like flavin-dependent oxidoreductase (luciferase family)
VGPWHGWFHMVWFRTMDLDLFYEVFASKPWGNGAGTSGQRERERRAYREALEQVRFADELDYRTAWFVEHHFREGRSHCPAPEVVIGALSQVTQRIRLGFGVSLLPHGFGPPMRVAEKVATCDILSNGRIEWGTGRSGPMEQIAFSVDQKNARDQWREAVQCVVGMWEEERYEFHGKYLDFPVRNVTPKPYQEPHPPCWMAGTSDGTAATAGSYGLGILLFSVLKPIDTLARQIREYKEAVAQCAAPLTRVVTNRVAALTLVNCGESIADCEKAGAFDACAWWYTNQAQFFLDWELKDLSENEKDFNFPLLKMVRDPSWDVRQLNDADMIIVGDPDQVYDKMLRYADIGVDQLLCLVQIGNLSHDSAMKTIELVGREVLPRLKKQGIQTKLIAQT